MPPEREPWMTLEEVADHVRLSRAKIYAMAQNGQIPCTKLAGRWRFSRDEIDTWMRQLPRVQGRGHGSSEGLPQTGGPMQMMTVRELQWLVGQQQPPCVSIYLPTHRHHPGTDQDRIRFKNALGRAASLLRERYRDQDIGQFLAPIEDLSTTEFWMYQEEGLAVFCAPGTCVHYRLPVTVPEIVVVSNTFHTKPLVGYLNSNRHYFVLSLSKKEVKLYEGSPHSLDQIEVQSLSQELRDLMGESGAKAVLSADPETEGGQQATRQGRGASKKDGKKELLKYFRAIDRALWPILRDERSPLVLAAVGYFHPLFREACRYPYLLDEGIEAGVAGMPLDSLREAAWRLVSSYEADLEGDLLGQYVRALQSGRASNELSDIAKAAAHGRIRVLLHEAGKSVWGRVDPDTGSVAVHEHQEQRDAEDADIIDDLCEMTLLKGGEVFEVSSSDLLRGAPLGAIYRY